MDELLRWFDQLFIAPSVDLAGTPINLLKVLQFLLVFSVFLMVAGVLRRLLRPFVVRLELDEHARERILWLAFLIVATFGLIIGLALFGIDLTLLERALTYSIPIGETELSLTKLLWLLAVVIGAVILSKYLRLVLRDRVLPPFHLPENAQFLLLRLLHVIIVMLGVLIGLNLTGLSLSSLMVVLGGLSIGIGFGLQNIASNLIAGVILIFEHPIRVGDRVTVGDMYGTVRAINMRSTVVVTDDNIEVIVPNSQFVSEAITNWTHSDKQVRLRIHVGAAYGSDTALVKQALLGAANEHPRVIKTLDQQMPSQVTPPFVRFLNFGDSSLDFELLVWIPDAAQRFDIDSDLHFMVDQKFREHNIRIPFPQRDVHHYYEAGEA